MLSIERSAAACSKLGAHSKVETERRWFGKAPVFLLPVESSGRVSRANTRHEQCELSSTESIAVDEIEFDELSTTHVQWVTTAVPDASIEAKCLRTTFSSRYVSIKPNTLSGLHKVPMHGQTVPNSERFA